MKPPLVPRKLEALPYAQYLEPHDGPLVPDSRYEGLHLSDAVIDDPEVAGARFLESAFSSVTFNAGHWRASRFHDVWIDAVRWIGGDLSSVNWLDVEINASVLAGAQVFDAQLRRVVFHGCKLDSVNLRSAKLQDVTFVDCQLVHVDFGAATLTNVSFPGSRIEGAVLERSQLKKVDFTGATSLQISGGYDSLRGATISTLQLMDLAHAFAETLGVTVRD